MTTREILQRELEKAGTGVKLVPIPPERRPTAESLAKLENEIRAQISANDNMRYRSYIKADKV